MKGVWNKALLAWVLACAIPGAPLDAAEEESGSDEDFARPPTRYDFRYNFQSKADGVDQSQFLLRRDVTWNLNERWQLATRIDVPLVLSNATGSDNPTGRDRFGLGDILVQAALVENPTERFGYGAGLRAIFPTASEDQLGSGKYRLLPIAGVRWKLPEIAKGAFFQFIARYDSDLGGDSSRKHISQLQVSPTFNIPLRDRWYLTLFPSQDIVLNCVDGHRWFVPADFLIGRKISDKIVASVEVSLPMVMEFTLYDFKLEARLSIHL